MPQSKPPIGNKQTRNPAPVGEEQFFYSGAEFNTLRDFFEQKLDEANHTWTNLSGKPSIFPPAPHTHPITDITGLQAALDAKQATLVSGTNIKTINGTSILGAGNIVVDGGGGGVGVASVTGDGVNNTDPLNPVIELANVATSGAYTDLTGRPTIPVDVSDLTDTTNLIPVDVSDLTDTTDLLVHEWNNLGGTQSSVNISGFTNDSGFENPTQLNIRDTNNRNRSNHTGTQLANTISDFSSAVAATAAVTANTAKVTNATHTGDVTGATVLTIANGVVDNAKLANMATKTYKGRTAAGTGAPEDVPVAMLKTDLALTKSDVGLSNVDNTSDLNKPISTATQTALDNKQDDLGIVDAGTELITPEPIYEVSVTTDNKLLKRSETEIVAEDKVFELTEESHPDQFEKIGPYAVMVSPYVKEASDVSNVSSVDFIYDGIKGSVSEPIYSLDKELEFVRLNAKENVEKIIYHSSQYTPNILVPFREVHQRVYTGVDSAAEIAQMLTDQANHVSGKGYLAGLSYYRYNGTPTGNIADYTLVTEGNSTGSKPEWLFLEGDTYLEGVNHLNKITAVFKPIHKVSGVSYYDVVVCTIEAHTNGNLDSTKPDLTQIGIFNLNENPSDIPSLTDLFFDDSSPYGNSYPDGEKPGSMVNPDNTVVVSLGGGQYAYRTNNESAGSADDPFLRFQGFRIPLRRVWTIVIKVRKWTGDAGGGTLGTNLIGSCHLANNSGGLKVFFSSQGTPRVSIAPTSLNGGQTSVNEARGSDANPDAKISSTEARTFVISFDGTNVSFKRNNNIEYLTSNVGAFARRTAESQHPIQIARNIDGSSNTDIEVHYIQFYNRLLTSDEILALP